MSLQRRAHPKIAGATKCGSKCGLFPGCHRPAFISPIVDATNFVMFDVGQPLHAFDADKVKGTIVVRAAKKGEKIELLDSSEGLGKEVELLTSDHVIADDIGPLAIAGVKGGKRAGITASTKQHHYRVSQFRSDCRAQDCHLS